MPYALCPMPYALCPMRWLGLLPFYSSHPNDFISSSPLFSSRRRKNIVLTENVVIGDSLSRFLFDNAAGVRAALVQAMVTAQRPFLAIHKSFRFSLNIWERLPMHLGKEVRGLVMFTFLGA
jgi:hypothetical protein